MDYILVLALPPVSAQSLCKREKIDKPVTLVQGFSLLPHRSSLAF